MALDMPILNEIITIVKQINVPIFSNKYMKKIKPGTGSSHL
jgi:hypothetical protein